MQCDEQQTAFEKAMERGRGSSALIGPSVGLAYLKQVPERAELSEDGLTVEWQYADDPSQGRPLPVDYTGVLGKFMAIRRAEQIPPFIEKYGKLNLCEEHQRPWNHNNHVIDSGELISQEQLDISTCVPGLEPESGVEPVQVWLDLVNQFRALLSLSKGVREEKPNILESPLWDVVKSSPESTNPEKDGPDFQQARPALAHCINNFLEIGNVRPQLLWGGSTDRPEFGYPNGDLGLFGVLALQLAMLVARADGIYTCSGCGDAYARTKARKPKPGQDNWCPVCRKKGIPNKIRMRELRQKQSELAKGNQDHE